MHDWPIFLGLTLCIFGSAAWLMGAAIAGTWRPYWQVFAYGLLLAVCDRFLTWSLFDAELMSLAGFLRDLAAIIFLGLFSWRFRQARLMVAQYPWLYKSAGPLNWRQR